MEEAKGHGYIHLIIPELLDSEVKLEDKVNLLKRTYTEFSKQKEELSEEFFVITDTHFFQVDTRDRKNPQVIDYEINACLGHSLYDLATFIATGDQNQRIIPANLEIEEKIKDMFGALGIEKRLKTSSVSLQREGTRMNSSTDAVVLDYSPYQ